MSVLTQLKLSSALHLTVLFLPCEESQHSFTFKFIQSLFHSFLSYICYTEILQITTENPHDKDDIHFAVQSTGTYMQILNGAIFAKKEKGYKGNLENIGTFIWIWLQHISCKHTRQKCHFTVTSVVHLL
jgi:hypothetical protein